MNYELTTILVAAGIGAIIFWIIKAILERIFK